MPRSQTHWNVSPRYSSGSPAALFRDHDQIKLIVQSETRNYKSALEGVYGEVAKARAEKLGLRGIVVLTGEKGKNWKCFDEVTGEHYDRPFDEKMRKAGFVRFTELHEFVRELIAKCEPIIVEEVLKDERPFWFRGEVKEFEFTLNGGTWDKPNTPANLIWQPKIEEAKAS